MANARDKSKVKVKRSGRKRRVAGWTLLLLGLLVAAVWVASRKYSLLYAQDRTIVVARGLLEITTGSTQDGDGRWHLYPVPAGDQRLRVRALSAEEALAPPGIDLYIFTSFRTPNDLSGRTDCLALWPLPVLAFAAGVWLICRGVAARRLALRAEQGLAGGVAAT